MYHIQDSVWKTGFCQQFCELYRRAWISSLGFRMKVFPQANAIGNIHIGTIAGKLNGVTPATTPSGCRNEKLSTSVLTCSENSPFNNCAIPQANSTTSKPR